MESAGCRSRSCKESFNLRASINLALTARDLLVHTSCFIIKCLFTLGGPTKRHARALPSEISITESVRALQLVNS